MSTVPDITSGTVTSSRRAARRAPVPNWLKALYAVLFTFLAVIAVALLLAPDTSGDTHAPQHCTTQNVRK